MKILKILIISFFCFILIFAINYISTQKNISDSKNYDIKNNIKKAINIGELRANDRIVIDDKILINEILTDYAERNKVDLDDISFEISLTNNIVTVTIMNSKNIFNNKSEINSTYSYEVMKDE